MSDSTRPLPCFLGPGLKQAVLAIGNRPNGVTPPGGSVIPQGGSCTPCSADQAPQAEPGPAGITPMVWCLWCPVTPS